MNQNLFDAIDTDNVGSIDINQVEAFIREFLRGNQCEQSVDTNFEDEHENLFKMIQENESGRLNVEELGKCLWELLRQQIQNLQKRLEQ